MLYLYITTTFLLLISYVFLLLFILYKWQQPQIELSPGKSIKDYSYSILIPVRNEEKNIADCLNSIFANAHFDFERLQVIVIDDYSEDNTVNVVQNFNHPNVHLLSLKESFESSSTSFLKINAFKKAALNLGLQHAKGDYIIQLDGDVLLTNNYLQTIDDFIRSTAPNFVAAPVVFSSNNSIYQDFQVLDFLGMMLVTQAGIESQLWYMANGANMIYKKELLDFDTNGQASGDDVFGIQSIAAKNKDHIYFLKSPDATVTTIPQQNFSGFVNQRMRWATKNKQMNLKMLVMMAVPFFNALWIAVHFFAIYFFGKVALIMLVTHLLFKMMVDYIYLDEAAQFFNKEKSMKHFISSYFLHLVYLSVIGLMSLFVKKYSWKGRKVY